MMRTALGVLPDALWSFAVAQLLLAIWATGPRGARAAWLAVGFVLATGWEIAQAAHFVPGTFDPIDLIASAFAYGVAVAVASTNRRLSS
jgi:hypothetical protein